LSAPDADLARERAGIVAALAAEGAAAFGAPHAPERTGKAMAGFLNGFGAHSRPSGGRAQW